MSEQQFYELCVRVRKLYPGSDWLCTEHCNFFIVHCGTARSAVFNFASAEWLEAQMPGLKFVHRPCNCAPGTLIAKPIDRR